MFHVIFKFVIPPLINVAVLKWTFCVVLYDYTERKKVFYNINKLQSWNSSTLPQILHQLNVLVLIASENPPKKKHIALTFCGKQNIKNIK